MNAIIIDDERHGAKVLEYEINQLETNIHVTDIFTDPRQAVQELKNKPPSLLFLDIQMPHLSGFGVLNELNSDIKFPVIFVTAHEKHAFKAFQYFALDYLLKPVDPHSLKQAIHKVNMHKRFLDKSLVFEMNQFRQSQNLFNDKMVVSTSSGYKILMIQDIVRCEADNNYTTLTMVDRSKIVVSKSLNLYHE